METPENLDTQDTQIPDKMSNSLDDYYCDDYDDYYNEHNKPEDLIKCGNCGNIWDGYAQCNCYQIRCYDSDSSVEQEQDLENPARKAAFEKSRAKNNSENDETESVNNEDTFENINSEDINHEN